MKIACAVNQAEAIRRGIDANEKQVSIEIDPAALTQSEREQLALYVASYPPTIPQPDAVGLLEALRADVARTAADTADQARRAAEHTAEAEAVLRERRTANKYVSHTDPPYRALVPAFDGYAPESVAWSPEARAWRAEIDAENALRLAAARAARDEARAQMQAEEAAKATATAARTAAREQIVREHGTPSQIERLEAGVLPAAELRTAVADWLLRAITAAPYQGLTSSDLSGTDEDSECTIGGHDISCEVTDAGEVDADTWSAAQAIRATLPEGAVSTIRHHHCTCDRDDCAAEAERYGLRVEITHGPLSVAREYTL